MGFFQRNFGTQQSWAKQTDRQAKIRRETERGRKDKAAEKARAAKKAAIDRRKGKK